ncbi:hypothetical protein B5X24_HaOG213951 [Helicoverpa armigera]|nr:hypothetical protein B5X24_HaOG213951 [Helicoverpa armigera]
MRDSSRKTVFLNTRKPEQRYKVLKFTEGGQAAGYCANMFEQYEKRPTEHPDYNFNNMCLIEFAMLFEPHYAKSPAIGEESIDTDALPREQTLRRRLITPANNTKMTIRNRPAVIRIMKGRCLLLVKKAMEGNGTTEETTSSIQQDSGEKETDNKSCAASTGLTSAVAASTVVNRRSKKDGVLHYDAVYKYRVLAMIDSLALS